MFFGIFAGSKLGRKGTPIALLAMALVAAALLVAYFANNQSTTPSTGFLKTTANPAAVKAAEKAVGVGFGQADVLEKPVPVAPGQPETSITIVFGVDQSGDCWGVAFRTRSNANQRMVVDTFKEKLTDQSDVCSASQVDAFFDKLMQQWQDFKDFIYKWSSEVMSRFIPSIS